MRYYKILIILLVSGYIIYQLSLIITQHSGTRLIEVRKEIYETTNEKDYLKGYNIENVPFEQFDIEVTPKSFLDYMLLTNEKGNLLSILLIIASGIFIMIYLFKLNVENIELSKNLTWVKFAILLIALAFMVYSTGLDHTRDFWKTIYINNHKNDFWNYAFYVETKSNAMIYCWIFIIIGMVIGKISDYYKPAKMAFKKREDVN